MKILIADDSKVMRQIVMRTLRQAGYSGYDLVEASNGREAFDLVRAEKPDLVLSDWNMPEMTGIELLQQLRGTGEAVPFGFVTSEGPGMRQQAEDAGATFLIAKPFTEETLRQAVDPILGRAVAGPTSGTARPDLVHPSSDPHPTPHPCEWWSMTPTALPNSKDVKDMLEGLLGRDVTVASSPPLDPDGLIVVGVFVDDCLHTVAAAAADFRLAAYSGAAIGLVPKGGAEAAMEDGILPDSLRDNFNEILDVLSALFNVQDRPNLRLHGTYAPREVPPPDVSLALRTLGRRLDLDVEVGGYGRGRLSLVLA